MPRPNESTPVGMCAELSQNRLKVAGGTVKQLQKPCKEPVLCLRLFFLFASMILSSPQAESWVHQTWTHACNPIMHKQVATSRRKCGEVL